MSLSFVDLFATTQTLYKQLDLSRELQPQDMHSMNGDSYVPGFGEEDEPGSDVPTPNMRPIL